MRTAVAVDLIPRLGPPGAAARGVHRRFIVPATGGAVVAGVRGDGGSDSRAACARKGIGAGRGALLAGCGP